MTDKELRKLNRRDLLEILISQTVENEQLKQELEETKAALHNRQIAIENVGSIAEASLQLSGIFGAAQEAAAQYLENIERMHSDAQKQAEAIIAEAREYSLRIRQEAEGAGPKSEGIEREQSEETRG